MIGRAITLAAGLLAGGTAAQAPEFLQQYEQRLGGARQELTRFITDFEADARRSNLTPADALARQAASSDPFLRDRAASIRRTSDRHARISAHLAELETAGPLSRPLLLVRNYDPALADGALSAFRPAVPVTLEGFVWAGAGFLAGSGLAGGLGRLTGRIARRRRGTEGDPA